MKIIKFKENVKMPSKSHDLDCGLDLYIQDEF